MKLPELRFKIDENMPLEAIPLLAEAGFDADSVYDEGLQGKDDSAIIATCKAEKIALITCDLDFADIRAYPPNQYYGIVVLRPDRRGRPSILELMYELIPSFKVRPLRGKLWVVNKRGIRVHEGQT